MAKRGYRIDVNTPEFRAMLITLYVLWQGQQDWGQKEYKTEIEYQKDLVNPRTEDGR